MVMSAATPAGPHPPNPLGIFQMMNAFQQTAALCAAVELDLFSIIASGQASADGVARAAQADARGVAILADFLVIHGLLTKAEGRYGLSPEAAMFLERRSPACLADTAQWFGYLTERGNLRQLGGATSRAGIPCRQSKPGHRATNGSDPE